MIANNKVGTKVEYQKYDLEKKMHIWLDELISETVSSIDMKL